MRLFPAGIRGRLFLLITLALLPMLSLFGWVYHERYATGRDQALQQELETAQGVAATFAAYLDGIQEQLNTVGQAFLTTSPYDQGQGERLLRAVLARYTTIRGIHWLSPEGVVLGSSVPGVIGRNLSTQSYFHRVLDGVPEVVDDLTPQGVIANEPAFVIATAIRDQNGILRGVMAASVDPLRLGVLTLIQQRIAGGEYLIFDHQGLLVYRNPETPLTWEQRQQARKDDSLLSTALEGRTALGETKSAALGDHCLAARAPIEDTGWAVGTGRSIDLALGPVRQGARHDAILAGLATSLAFVCAYLVARTISGPLRRLEHDACAVQGGCTEMPTDAEPLAEVRRLRHTVAHMAMDLIRRADAVRASEQRYRELTQTLEVRVARRTAELKQRARQLQKLTLELSDAEERERERLAQILHDDLQQELAAAKLHLGLIRSQVRDDPALLELTAQIDQMLKNTIGKSRSLSHELSPAVLHGGDFSESLQWLADHIQTRYGLIVHVHGEAYPPSDSIRAFLYRTAQELLFNVVKHAGVPQARVRVRQWGEYIALSIADRGRGFEPRELQKTAGFGLLSIRERIGLLGGHMKIKSTRGRGSTFLVLVPADEQHLAPPPSGVKTVQPRVANGAGVSLRAYPLSTPRSADGGPPLRVLLADDHELVRQGLASLLSEDETLEIVGEAADGREAVDLARRLHPDVVVMDVSMPVMNGDEATRRIKHDLSRTRIVGLSMFEKPQVRRRMHEAGAEGYVLKTAPAESLLAAIHGEESDL